MNIFFGLVIGLSVGWVIEWIIDYLFWRHDDKQLQEKLNQAEAKIRDLQARVAEDEKIRHQLIAVQHEATLCQDKLVDAEITIDQLCSELNAVANKIPEKRDNLERVKGIGIVFAKRLNNAGIYTFAQLATLTPERIERIIQPAVWQKIEPDKWITEAKEFMAENNIPA